MVWCDRVLYILHQKRLVLSRSHTRTYTTSDLHQAHHELTWWQFGLLSLTPFVVGFLAYYTALSYVR